MSTQPTTSVTRYRCALVSPEGRCERETAAMQHEDAPAVPLDAAWLTIRIGLWEERHFCSWDHLARWVALETVTANVRGHDDAEPLTGPGEVAQRMRNVAASRDRREQETAAHMRERTMRQREAAALLGLDVTD